MSALQIIDCEQNSPEWLAARCGVVTASEFDSVLAKGRGGTDSKTRRTYMLKLAGEILTGQPAEGYGNAHMQRGHDLEPEARDLFALTTGLEPVRVGFMRRGPVGCSPDSLLGDTGLLEVKTKLPHLQLETLLADQLPPEHRAQVQGQLWVSGREWVDFVSYWPRLPIFIKRVHRDESYIAALKVACDDFLAELHETLARIAPERKAA